MTEGASRRPLLAGRVLAIAAIVLLAANLRTAVASLSPILHEVQADVPLGPTTVGLLGMLAPLSFAAFALLTPVLANRVGLEASAVLALVALALGLAGRGIATEPWVLVATSAVAFASIGIGNALLPPLVKRYFPDRVGLMTSVYVAILAVSTLVPPLVAVPVAGAAGWRVSLGLWAGVVIAALVPWIALLARSRRRAEPHPGDGPVGPSVGPSTGDASAGSVAGDVGDRVDPVGLRHAFASPLAWWIATMLAVSALNVYTLFAWLPELLAETAGTGAAANGALLALYAGVGAPAGIIVPIVAARTGRIGLLTGIGIACFVVGDLGLLLAPGTATWLWVAFAGLGPLTFPLALVLINLRTRTHAGAVVLSGFVQSVGYLIAAVFPLLIGVLHGATDGWTVPLLVLLATSVPLAFAGAAASRPRFLEDGRPAA
ncbi:MFS transporter [Agromyces sp. MMS24-JH15]|uniref:MFS transporter n=1 Tax=Agromyces sp. MMS24-JH15 TaxID=3243765 RepID=UPI0037488DFB